MTIRINPRFVILGATGGALVWAVVKNIVSPLQDAGAMHFWAWLTLSFGLAAAFYVGEQVNGWIEKRAWKHYWLAQGYSTEAADKKFEELRQVMKDAIRGGTFFKGYGPKKE